jgi:hypothetical protein
MSNGQTPKDLAATTGVSHSWETPLMVTRRGDIA